ncbi:MAG: divergent polysaccharide deacetylase family protein [Alphaproteobacteria bacterium]|nr:divergent polysaccharide deacetylase family protein [Alphaproteobacteria bacterium]
MKKSSIFIVLLLCIVVAELFMVFKSGAGEKNDKYVLDSKVYDMPMREAEIKTVKPLLLEMQATDETEAILDEFATDITKAMAVQKSENKEVQIVTPVDDMVSAEKELENQVLFIQDEKLIENSVPEIKTELTEEKAVMQEGTPESLLPVENSAPEVKTELTEEKAVMQEGTPESLLPVENSAPEIKTELTEENVIIEEKVSDNPLQDEEVKGKVKPEVVKSEISQEQEPAKLEKTQEQTASAEQEMTEKQVISETSKVYVEVSEKNVVKENDKVKKRAKIAIVIDDVGLNTSYVKQISQIKAPLTVSFLPYGASSKEQVMMLKDVGFEVLVHIPMMPHIPAALAPVTLSPEMDKSETQAELNKMLDRFDGTGIGGVNNHMGSLLTERIKNMEYVMEVLKKRGMFFLDSKTTGKSVAEKAAAEYGVPHIARDIFLDNKKDYKYIMGQFRQTEKIAQKNGYAVAIGHPYSQTLNVLQDWLKEAENNGFEVVHISELLHK